jgi:hypothetical protein
MKNVYLGPAVNNPSFCFALLNIIKAEPGSLLFVLYDNETALYRVYNPFLLKGRETMPGLAASPPFTLLQSAGTLEEGG